MDRSASVQQRESLGKRGASPHGGIETAASEIGKRLKAPDRLHLQLTQAISDDHGIGRRCAHAEIGIRRDREQFLAMGRQCGEQIIVPPVTAQQGTAGIAQHSLDPVQTGPCSLRHGQAQQREIPVVAKFLKPLDATYQLGLR